MQLTGRRSCYNGLDATITRKVIAKEYASRAVQSPRREPHRSGAELLNCYSQVLRELRERGVIRTKNLAGDIAEGLVAARLGLVLATNSNAGYDAIDPNGLRYQVKSRLPTLENPSTELGAIRNLDKREFDYLVGILLDPEFGARFAVKVPYETVVRYARYKASQNGHVLHLQGSWLKDPSVEDVTHLFLAG